MLSKSLQNLISRLEQIQLQNKDGFLKKDLSYDEFKYKLGYYYGALAIIDEVKDFRNKVAKEQED